MLVLNTTSPPVSPDAPAALPRNTVPFSECEDGVHALSTFIAALIICSLHFPPVSDTEAISAPGDVRARGSVRPAALDSAPRLSLCDGFPLVAPLSPWQSGGHVDLVRRRAADAVDRTRPQRNQPLCSSDSWPTGRRPGQRSRRLPCSPHQKRSLLSRGNGRNLRRASVHPPEGTRFNQSGPPCGGHDRHERRAGLLVDSEDHDWAEVPDPARPRFGDHHDHARRPFRRWKPASGPTGARRGCGSRGSRRLADRLPATEYTVALRETLERCYTPGSTLTRAFARFLDALLGQEGLVVFEADNPAAKPLVSHIFTRELAPPVRGRPPGPCRWRANGRGGSRSANSTADDTVSLFYLDASGRRPIAIATGSSRIGDEPRSSDLLTAEASTRPERFSPNVLLRPLVQDALFPTLTRPLAGPSELAYQVQLAELYAAHGLQRPMLVSRASATLVDSAALKFLERSAMPLEALQPQDESALNRLLEGQLPPQLEASCPTTTPSSSPRPTAFAGRRHRSTQPCPARSIRPSIVSGIQVRTLQSRIVQAAKKKDETLRRQFTRTRSLAFPDRQPQERHLNLSFFLNRYGLDLQHDC